VGRAKGKIEGAAGPFPACGQTAIVSIYRSDVVGRHENKIRFVLFSEETQEFVGKYYAYAKPEVGIHLHRGHSYRVRLGNSPEFPIIEEVLEEVLCSINPTSPPRPENQ